MEKYIDAAMNMEPSDSLLEETLKDMMKNIQTDKLKVELSNNTMEEILRPVVPMFYKPKDPRYAGVMDMLDLLMCFPRKTPEIPLHITGASSTRYVNILQNHLRMAINTKKTDALLMAKRSLLIYYEILHPTKVDFPHVAKDIFQFYEMFMSHITPVWLEHLMRSMETIDTLGECLKYQLRFIDLCRKIKSTVKEPKIQSILEIVLRRFSENPVYERLRNECAAELIAEEERQKSKKPSKKKSKLKPRMEISDSDEEECFVEVECVICMEEVPTVTFDCKHRICCAACAEKIKQKCPYCTAS